MKLTVTVYKYKSSAPWMILLMVLTTVLFFFYSTSFHPLVNVFGIALLVLFAVYAALRPKSVFSLRAIDERKLIFTPNELIWDNKRIAIDEVGKLEVYIHAFDSFKYRCSGPGARTFATEYGDRNTISFIYLGIRYDWMFLLGTFNHYDTLVQIIQSWRDSGINFSARTAFTDSYIREQVKLFG